MGNSPASRRLPRDPQPGGSLRLAHRRTNRRQGGSFHFTTKDSSEKVIAFCETALKNAGMKVTINTTREAGAAAGGMVMGEDEAKKRNVMVTVGASDGSTTVNVVFSAKN